MTLPPDFPWRPGMLALQYGAPARLGGLDKQGRWNAWDDCGVRLRFASMDGIEVDPNDGATLGAMLAAVREAYRDPLAHAWPTEDQEGLELTRWYVRVPAVYGSRAIGQGDTEFDALLAAWNARPRSA